jgi:hypothetical protein
MQKALVLQPELKGIHALNHASTGPLLILTVNVHTAFQTLKITRYYVDRDALIRKHGKN